jgi:2-methylcitrate dehydratase PrpD
MTDGFTAAVAARVAGLQRARLPDEVVEVARQCVLDWLGVTLAGSREPAAAIALGAIRDDYPGDRGATVVGRQIRLPPLEASLVNGTASHALDYDDVNPVMVGHPTAAVLPAVLALGEARHSTGGEAVAAFIAGYEAQCRIAAAVGATPYQRGFHATGTIGTFGAAAACARLLRLDTNRTAVALGLAATQAAGIKSMFGTMAKPLHAGKACANGMLAARLAAEEFTAHPAAIEAEQGFAEVSGGDLDTSWADREPPGGWFLRQNLFKYHAACFQTHSMIEGLRRLRAREGFSAEDVQSVVVHASAMQLRMCAIPEPATGLEAKFSLRHLAGMTLAGLDTAAIDEFTGACATDPELVALRARVRIDPDGQGRGGATPVEVHLTDGRTLTAAEDVSVPANDPAVQRAAVQAKFEALAEPVLGVGQTARLADRTSRLEHLADVGELLALTRVQR